MQHILVRSINENEPLKKLLQTCSCSCVTQRLKSSFEDDDIEQDKDGAVKKSRLNLNRFPSLTGKLPKVQGKVWNLQSSSVFSSPHKTFKNSFTDSSKTKSFKVDFSNYPQYSYEKHPNLAKVERNLEGHQDPDSEFKDKAVYSSNGNIVIKKEKVDSGAPPAKKQLSPVSENIKAALRKPSQYDEFLLVDKLEEFEKDEKMFSLLKTFIDAPLNSFVSVYGEATKPYFPSHPKDLSQQSKSYFSIDTGSLQNYVSEMLSSKKETKVPLKKSETIVHRADINMRTRHLIKSIKNSSSVSNRNENIIRLKNHLLNFPTTRITAIEENAINELIEVAKECQSGETYNTVKMNLAMLGHVDPPKGRGLRILSLDGGGCRGAVSVEILHKLSVLCGQPINELFDYICGVSTGAILTFLLGIKKYKIENLVPLYRDFGSQIFQRGRLEGVGTLFLTHSYYNTENYTKILKEVLGDELLIQSSTYEKTPKCCAVSALVNRTNAKPYIWRNYSIVPGTRHSHWPGTCRATLWEAARASSAAPGYFEQFVRGKDIHQDGAMFSNNPSGIALNECHVLWPNVPLQCLVSVGSGRYEPSVGPTMDQLSLREKFMKVVDGATNVSGVHSLIYDLLPKGTYFRFDPFINEPLMIDDYEPRSLDIMVRDANAYIERNQLKFEACAQSLMTNELTSTNP